MHSSIIQARLFSDYYAMLSNDGNIQCIGTEKEIKDKFSKNAMIIELTIKNPEIEILRSLASQLVFKTENKYKIDDDASNYDSYQDLVVDNTAIAKSELISSSFLALTITYKDAVDIL